VNDMKKNKSDIDDVSRVREGRIPILKGNTLVGSCGTKMTSSVSKFTGTFNNVLKIIQGRKCWQSEAEPQTRTLPAKGK
jgi:hypothetical protein